MFLLMELKKNNTESKRDGDKHIRCCLEAPGPRGTLAARAPLGPSSSGMRGGEDDEGGGGSSPRFSSYG